MFAEGNILSEFNSNRLIIIPVFSSLLQADIYALTSLCLVFLYFLVAYALIITCFHFNLSHQLPTSSERKRISKPPLPSWKKMDKSKEYKNDNVLREYQLEGVNWLTFSWYNRLVGNIYHLILFS